MSTVLKFHQPKESSALELALSNKLVQQVETLSIRREGDSFRLKTLVRFPQDYRTHTIEDKIYGDKDLIVATSWLLDTHLDSYAEDAAEMEEWKEAISEFIASNDPTLTLFEGSV